MLIFTDVPASGMYFLTYEVLKEWTGNNWGKGNGMLLLGTIFAGGMAGIANWSIGMPADVLKSRLQTGKYINSELIEQVFF